MRIRAASLVLLLSCSAFWAGEAVAGLAGATVQTVVFPGIPYPPPAVTAADCAADINCNVPGYGTGQNLPLPIVPVNYLQDPASWTTISVYDTEIVITNDLAGFFCPVTEAGVVECTSGYFGGYVFTFYGAPDITGVTETHTGNFAPVPIGGTDGLTSTANTITLNVGGAWLNVGDTITLDVTTGSPIPPVPEPSTWAMILAGLCALGLIGRRRASPTLARMRA